MENQERPKKSGNYVPVTPEAIKAGIPGSDFGDYSSSSFEGGITNRPADGQPLLTVAFRSNGSDGRQVGTLIDVENLPITSAQAKAILEKQRLLDDINKLQ